ncbi:MAG TPA: hypothetical protein VK524_32050 [Polyangiaceae bacterium]|nr:hypothetical protein [Polyangiaceae bacterium]
MLERSFRHALASCLLSLLGAGVAQASEIFPEELRTHLQLPALPACTLCHASDAGGIDTVITPFGISLLGFGVVALNPSSLRAALDAAETEGVDSDFDDTPDIEELRQGTDPNDGVDLPTPMTGCAFRSRPRSGFVSLLAAVLYALLVYGSRRRARRRTSPDSR